MRRIIFGFLLIGSCFATGTAVYLNYRPAKLALIQEWGIGCQIGPLTDIWEPETYKSVSFCLYTDPSGEKLRIQRYKLDGTPDPPVVIDAKNPADFPAMVMWMTRLQVLVPPDPPKRRSQRLGPKST